MKETDPKPRSRKLCPGCETSPSSCRSHRWLSGRCCCDDCEQRNGEHDGEVGA